MGLPCGPAKIMHRFFTDQAANPGQRVMLSKEDAAHCLRVLRLNAGDEIELVSSPHRFRAEIESIQDGEVHCRVMESLPSTEAKHGVILFQGLPKSERMDYIVQKATELGIEKIVPVMMIRSVVRLEAKEGEKKAVRWAHIEREAVKQCGRTVVPQISAPLSFQEALKEMEKADVLLVPWEDAHEGGIAEILKEADCRTVGIVIGPEGGISQEEIRKMESIGGRTVTMGPRILRVDTAATAAICLAMQALGEL